MSTVISTHNGNKHKLCSLKNNTCSSEIFTLNSAFLAAGMIAESNALFKEATSCLEDLNEIMKYNSSTTK
jgi:hypothetical protein